MGNWPIFILASPLSSFLSSASLAIIIQLSPIKPPSFCHQKLAAVHLHYMILASTIFVQITYFKMEALQCSYKAFFQGRSLGATVSRISSKKSVPTGLKPQECKLGRHDEKATIHNVLEPDLVQESVEGKLESRKCTLVNRTETQVMVWF